MRTQSRALLLFALFVTACSAEPDPTSNKTANTEGCGNTLCGNGTVDPGEQCDPPNGSSCDSTCQIVAVCGDCVVQAGEDCDPPNGTTCDATCHIPVAPSCGDGVVNQPSEQCDPPDGTTCDASCQTIVVPSCGDGAINQASEECEPPNTAAGNFTPGCSATCTIAPTLCATCEAGKCDAFFGEPGAWGCAGLSGSAKASCEALVTCIRDTDCAIATHDPQACYCGTASDLGCLTGSGNGACKAQYEAAAGTTDPGTIAGLFTDPSSPVGLANNQITCDADESTPSCTSVCPL